MIIVLLGETASGKDYLSKRILADMPELTRTVTYTTRPKRKGEIDGVDYYYVTEDKMVQMIAANSMLEHAKYETVHGDWYYGSHVNSFQNNDKDYLAILDYQGYLRVKKMYQDDVIGFMIHRDYDTRKHSYIDRGGDLEEFMRRCKDDKEKFDMAHSDKNLYHVDNDMNRTEDIIKAMEGIILGGLK